MRGGRTGASFDDEPSDDYDDEDQGEGGRTDRGYFDCGLARRPGLVVLHG